MGEDFKSTVDKMLEEFELQESLNSCAWHIPQENIPGSNVPAKNNNHMLAERQRRRRENELLHTLKNLIPYPVKRDKLSILQGAIAYVQQLQLQAESEEEECKSPMKSQELESSKEKRILMRVSVEAGKLMPALARLRELGLEVSSLELSHEGLRAEIGLHSLVEGSPSCSELQQILDRE